jgi:5-methylcytosine-specific restriction endonuclease McrA
MGNALVLNASYEPLSVVSARRAVVLLLREKADLIEANGERWRSERHEVMVPSVIRLRTYVRVPYASRAPLHRRAVFARDSGTCQYCGARAENLDHVVPRSRGGTHTWENVVAACRSCNNRKGNRTPSEVGLRLAREPEAPRRMGWVLVALGSSADPRWNAYLDG